MTMPQMRYVVATGTLLLALATTAAAQATDAVARRAAAARGARLTIALIAEDQTGERDWTKPFMTAAFEDKLLAAGRFRVLSRSELDAVLAEQKMAVSGFVDPAQAVRIGKAASANYVVVVKQLGHEQERTVLPPGVKVTLNLQAQVIDTETAELVYSETYGKSYRITGIIDWFEDQAKAARKPEVTRPYREAVENFATAFAAKVAAAVPLEAIVATVTGGRIAITGGAEVGLRAGAEFDIIEEGPEIVVAGQLLGHDSKTIGRVKVTKVDPKLAWVEVVRTFDDGGKEDATPDVSKIQPGHLARMVGQ